MASFSSSALLWEEVVRIEESLPERGRERPSDSTSLNFSLIFKMKNSFLLNFLNLRICFSNLMRKP